MAVYSAAVMWEIIFLLFVKCITLTCASGTYIGGDIVVDTNLTLNGTPYVVTQDLIVAENATLSIQPGVQLHFDVAVSLKVKGSLVAKGDLLERIVFTINPTNNSMGNSCTTPLNLPYNVGIRLRDGSTHQDGRLEIFVNGLWGTVCDDGWDISDTQVACRQLGFKEAKRFYTFGRGDGPIWLDDVSCHGHELSLLHCRHHGIGSHNCGHSHDVGIECQKQELSAKYPLWSGIEFTGSKTLRVIKYVDISQAHKAISGDGFLPHLDHVTIKRSLYGLMTINGRYPLSISNSSIRDNLFAAIYLESHSGNVTIENTVMENTTFGFQYLGIASDSVDFCSFQGCCTLVVLNCSLSDNRINGISLKDFIGKVDISKTIFSRNGMDGLTVERTYGKITVVGSHFINNNASALRLWNNSFLLCKNRNEYEDNSTMVINRNSFVGNKRGGIILSPNSYWGYSWRYWNNTRTVNFVVKNNHFEQNKVNSIYVNCFPFLGSNSSIESNTFLNNNDRVVTFLLDNHCKPDRKGNSIIMTINGNTFTQNRVDNVIYIDYNLYPETRSASIGNNTFKGNEPPTKELFPNFFRRMTSRAVIVLKEGNFTVYDNIFENPDYTFQISSLLPDHHRIVNAEMNWWGTADGCKIMDRVFDFQHNSQLSQFQLLPYYTFLDKSAVSTSRPYCFLRGSSIGGSLDRLLTLSNADSPYNVRQDVVILTNGTLVIPKNVTLRFPPRSVMVVKGTLIVNGTENEKVRFSTKPYQEKFRLAGGAGPWEGRVEFLLNNTWSPVCLSHNRSFTSESKIVCQQLDLYYQTYGLNSSTEQGTGFVHNVICDDNIDKDIMNCSASTWSYRPTCTGYTVHVTCQQYNWAGLHLAMTNHQSSLRYLEILDAGFAYHSDSQISGAALKIDLNHHRISNIFINNSSGIGVQVVYQSLLHYTSLMPQSTISYTKSHGVLSYSPFLILTDINTTRNDRNGFIFKVARNSWYIIHTFTAEMASRDMKKTLYICSHNKTFISAERVFYFSLEALKDSLQFRCQHVVDTEPGYIIVIQELYMSSYLNDYHAFLHVYNGTNMPLGTPFKMGRTSVANWHVFTSMNSTILFDFFKRSGINEVINFLVYTVKESQTIMYSGGEIKIARANIANSLQSGILIERTFSTNVTVQDCVVNGSLDNGIYISAYYHYYWSAPSTIRILNSSIAANRQRGLYIWDYSYGNDFNTFLTGNLISLNIRGGVLYHSYGYRNTPSLEIKFNRFLHNEGSTVEIRSYGYSYSGNQVFTIVDNLFEENLGSSVTLRTHYWRQTLLIHRNLFLSNRIPDNAVIVIGRYRSRGTVDIRNNIFTQNSGRCLLLEGTVSNGQLTVTNNLFRENYSKDKSVIVIFGVDRNTTIEMNIFTKNRANSVALFQMVHDIYSLFDRRIVAFKNNTLYDNFPYPETQYVNASDSCALVLTGVVWPNETEFYFNKFNNTQYLMELCVRVFATSEHDAVNATHNWWGAENDSEVHERISDSYDNYDFAVAIIWPILKFNGDNLISLQQHDVTQKSNILSGRLFESLTLKPSQGPYFVASDLIVMGNVTLTIEAGVTVKVSPRKSILVAGTLHALGTLAKPVTFTVTEPTEDNMKSQFPVRLVDGDFPWKGRAEVFYNKSWKPISVSNILVVRNIASLLCRQLGYGPNVVAEGKSDDIGLDGKGSQMVEVGCYGNETALQECSLYLVAPNKTIALPVVNCGGVPWGNVRFVPPRDENISNLQSVLNHVQFSYCGNRHGAAVPAIEIVNSAPKLQFVTVKNCTSGGLRIFSPRTDIHLNHSTFINAGGTGISFVKTHQSILLDSLESSKNLRGVSFEQPNGENIPRVYYGRVFVCGVEKSVTIRKLTYLYFDTLKVKDAAVSITCQKVLTVSKGQGIKVTLLHTSGTHRVRIYDSEIFNNLIVDSWYGGLNAFVDKDLFIPRETIILEWIGDTNSEIVIQVEDIDVVDSPCTYDIGLCGWKKFKNTTLEGLNITKTWEIQAGSPFYVHDFSYLYYYGKVLLAGSYYYSDRTGGLAAMISPPITKQSQLCSFVYFYLLRNGDAALSVYIQTGTSAKIDHRLIWRSKDDYVGNWRKVVIDLPNDIDEYRLLLVARYNSSHHSTNYVAVDNLLLSGCSAVKEHRISNSVFSGNQHQAINYASATGSSDNPPYLTIERCKVTDGFFLNLNPKTSIFLDIHDTAFAITNNFIYKNRFGGITVQSGRSEGRSSSTSLVFGNTFSSNENGTILELRKQRNVANYSFIYIKDNIFESNLGYGIRIVQVSDEACEIVNNFFYNNTGLHILDFQFNSPWQKGQEGRCELNTFYHNQGFLTVSSNGPTVYRRNIFENPSITYEFRSTYWSVIDPIDVAHNWWGSGNESVVSLRIYDKNDSYRLAAVEYRPIQKSPPSNLLTDDCPLGWIKKGQTCYTYRGGSRTLQEANNYCKVSGGHVTSTHVFEDMELINLVMKTTRPDGKPNAPIWITTEGNNDWEDLNCTVVTPDGLQEAVSCDSLYPFVCTRAVLQCFSCIPNTTMVPPFLCDKPTDYAVVNCHNSTSCLITSLTTSTNQLMHMMTCGEAITPNSSALNCSEIEKYVCENVLSTMLNSSEVKSASCRSVCCEENKCNVKDLGATDPPATTFTPTTEAPVSVFECFSCTPNTTMMPPFLCDDTSNYTVERCDKSTSCLSTTLKTSSNQPIYMMACGEAIAPNSSALNCPEMEKYVCENVISTMLNSSEVNLASCRSVCCEENKCNVKDLGATEPPATTFTPTTEAPGIRSNLIISVRNSSEALNYYKCETLKPRLSPINILTRRPLIGETWFLTLSF